MNLFEKAVDIVDSAVFNGDPLMDANNRAFFKRMIDRWQKKLGNWEEIAAQIAERGGAGGTIASLPDLMGMNPRTVAFNKDGDRTIISVVVPLNHMRAVQGRCASNLKLTIDYHIEAPPYANSVSELTLMSCGRDYNTSSGTVEMVLTEDVLLSIRNAFRYFRYVKEHLENHKTDPMLYESWGDVTGNRARIANRNRI